MSQPPSSSRHPSIALALIVGLYALARIFEVTLSPAFRTAAAALDVLSALSFALVDGARRYRPGRIIVFAAICLVIANLSENLSIATGFPFGHYRFATLMGPMILEVPVLLGLAYIGMAYASWIVGSAIVHGGDWRRQPGLAVPVVAAFIMVAWDLAQDPIWSTVLHGWLWRDGGAWFGVPVSNYLGWYGTVFCIYLLFSLYLRRSTSQPLTDGHCFATPAIVFYALCAAGNVLQIVPHPNPAVVLDPSGHAWRVNAITRASALVSIFAMGTFIALALLRARNKEKPFVRS